MLMKKFLAVVATGIFLSVIHTANANIINFINLTETGGYGEGAWTNLALTSGATNLWVTGHSSADDDNTQYAYLDWGRAGLGVCKDAMSVGMVDMLHPGNKANNCNPDHDDNTTNNEYLQFVFDKNVLVKNIWFNNNHDGGLKAGDQATIAGNQYNIATGYAGGSNGVGMFSLSAFSPLNVEYYNKQFYISGIEFVDVAEPSSTIIFALGVLSLMYARQKRS